MNDLAPPGVHALLRAATTPAHQTVDTAFARFDLGSREGLGRFLAAHHAALAPLMPGWRRFVNGELELPAPDWPALLTADLADLGRAPPAPRALPGPVLDGAVGYVVAGSRLGLAMIRRQGWWGEAQGLAGRYLTSNAGPQLWQATRDWLARQPQARAEPLAADAARVFALFAAAAEGEQ